MYMGGEKYMRMHTQVDLASIQDDGSGLTIWGYVEVSGSIRDDSA